MQLPECRKSAPDGAAVTCFPCAEAACCGCFAAPEARALAALSALGRLARLRPHRLPPFQVSALRLLPLLLIRPLLGGLAGRPTDKDKEE